MHITCPNCQFQRDVSDEKIPPQSQKAICPKCKEVFQFRNNQEEKDLLLEKETKEARNETIELNGHIDKAWKKPLWSRRVWSSMPLLSFLNSAKGNDGKLHFLNFFLLNYKKFQFRASMIRVPMLLIVAIISGSVGAVLLSYAIYFSKDLLASSPNEMASEMVGLMYLFVMLVIFKCVKVTNRKLFKYWHPMKIGVFGAVFIGLVVSITTVYAATQTNLHIAKNNMLKQETVTSYKEANKVFKSYVYQQTNRKGLIAYLEFSVRQHPFFPFLCFCFLQYIFLDIYAKRIARNYW
jgi:predicted Zn finger-like uncharacterized protein